MYEPKTKAERRRIYRYNVYLMCKMLHKLPDEIEAMDAEWFQDFGYFATAEDAAHTAKKG